MNALPISNVDVAVDWRMSKANQLICNGKKQQQEYTVTLTTIKRNIIIGVTSVLIAVLGMV